MFTLFGRQRPALLGLDVSSTAVKLLELSVTPGGTGSNYQVESYGVEPLPPNAVVEKKIADIEAVGNTIKKVVQRSRTKIKRAAVAVSGSAIITKTISLPASLSDPEMETQIQLEADQYIPYPLEEVNIDFDVLGPSTKNADMVDVLLAASRRENVDDRVSALEIAGIAASIVDVEAYTMENACTLLLGQLPDKAQAQTIAVADLGATTTTLHVLHENQIVYTREQNFGGHQLTNDIQRHYGLTREQASLAKCQGGLPDNYEPEVLAPFKEAIAQQINRALQFFYSGSNFSRVDQIILAGGTASVQGIAELVEERIGSPAVVADPFNSMSLAGRIDPDQLRNDAPAMMIAAGLALRSFD